MLYSKNKQMKNLLILEDQPLIRKYLKKSFEKKFNVYAFECPSKIINKLNEMPKFDFILSDYLMINMTGLEFYNYLIQSEYFIQITNNFCFMTAYEDNEIYDNLIRTGCRIIKKKDLNPSLVEKVFLK